MTVVLKLGGSVITDKGRERTLDDAAMDRVTTTVAGSAVDDLVLVLGGGSFGHPAADRHGLSTAAGTADAAAVAEVHAAMLELSGIVVDRLQGADVPAVALHPLSMGYRDGDRLTLDATAVCGLLGEGFVPVLHGDGVATAGAGVTILSGDEIVATLTTSLDADRVGMCTGVAGVLDAEGEVIDRIGDLEAVTDVIESPAGTDVTGGMGGKIRRLLDLDRPASVFGLDGLGAFLAGGNPGTTVDPAG